MVKIFYVKLRYTSLTSENDVSSWLGICSSFYFKINLCKGQTDQSNVIFFPIKFLFRLNEHSLSSQSKYWAKIPSVHYVLKLVAILLCFFVYESIPLTYVNVKSSGLFLVLFGNMILHNVPSRCLGKVNNKKLKDCGNFPMKM